jgi:hypothetical protein
MDSKLDRWVRRGALAAMLALAAALLGVGVALYGPAHAQAPTHEIGTR